MSIPVFFLLFYVPTTNNAKGYNIIETKICMIIFLKNL